MKIHSLKINNFRGYKEEIEILFDNLTVLVGKNDVGKSTILEALDIFFNDGKGVVKLEKSDVNIQEQKQGNQETTITICFCDLPDSIIIDSSVQTSLVDEYLLNGNGFLEVEKKYKNGGAPKVFIKAKHPTNVKCTDLLLKKNTELKKILQTEEIKCENQTVNSLLRKAIWQHFSAELNTEEIEIDASKEDAKKIWDKLSLYLPIYSLFQSDRKNSDGDSEVQEKLQEVASRTLEKLREMDPEIANSLNPIIPTAQSLKWQDVFKGVSISGDEDIPINKRGSGVKRLVLLNFFRGEVERRFNEGDNTGVIYAIEEPETSQHTDNQRKLIDALKTLAAVANVQVILTTHSAFIVKQLEFSNLRMITDNQYRNKEVINVLPGQLQYPSLNEVNYIAFNDITEEYHDELYSYIEFQRWKNSYFAGKQTRTYHRQKLDGSIKDEQKVLTEYIRHQIHHPENHHNIKYTNTELKQSIDDMREFINNIVSTEGVNEP